MIIEDLTKIKEVPSNIREHIFKILDEKGFIKGLVKELTDLGYSQEEISDEFEIMSTQKSILYEKVIYPVWSLPGEEIGKGEEVEAPVKEKKVSVKHVVIEETIKTDKEKLRVALSSEPEKAKSTEKAKPKEKKKPLKIEKPVEQVSTRTSGSLKDSITHYLKEKKIVATKPQFIKDIVAKGFAKNSVEKEINSLKEQGIITYSRAKPKGWSLAN